MSVTSSHLWLYVAGSAVVCSLLIYPVCAALRRAGIVDQPNMRSSHTAPTVRGAGIVIVLVVGAVLGVFSFNGLPLLSGSGAVQSSAETLRAIDPWFIGLVTAFAVLAVVSFIDDISGVRAIVRLGLHAAAALVAVVALGRIEGWRSAAIPAIAWFWIVGYTNAFNFMDGINGIAAAQAVVTGLGTAAIARQLGLGAASPIVVLALVVAGSALGFLPHNFPTARVFMGDVSSASVGFLLAVLAYWTSRVTAAWVLFWIGLLHANFVLDTAITLLRRAWRRERLYEAHREHFYQRLVRGGRSHTEVTLAEGGLQIGVAFVLWWATPQSAPVRCAVAAAVVVLWLVYFGYAEAVFRKANVAKLQSRSLEQEGREAREVARR